MCKSFTSETSNAVSNDPETTATSTSTDDETTSDNIISQTGGGGGSHHHHHQWTGMKNAASAVASSSSSSHPTNLDDFYYQYPSFLWGPVLVASLLYFTTTQIPAVVTYMERHDMTPLGFPAALQYTVFAIVTSYACYGFCVTHAPHGLKIQASTSSASSAPPSASEQYHPNQNKVIKPDAMAIRSTAALLTELIVYPFLPLAPSTSTTGWEMWWKFAAWTAALAVYWDAHFYAAHRFAHEHKAAYRFFHKMHHLCKEPNCFGAYFVTYQSHVVLEQVVIFLFAAAGLPRNVFLFTMYWGTIGTFVEHSGYELGSMKLPLLLGGGLTFGQLCSIVGASTSWLLDGVNVAEHDWHHEKFTTNYSLSFKYLDKLFGTYHPGREPGTGKVLPVLGGGGTAAAAVGDDVVGDRDRDVNNKEE